MGMTKKERREMVYGLAFLAPNILGFVIFALVPLVFSLVLAFSNWDLKLHNMFKDEAIRMVGIDNFVRLLTQDNFWRFLGNTLFIMMGIPFSVAGSLLLAILLTRDLRGGSRPVFLSLLAAFALFASVVLLTILGAGTTAMTLLLTGVGCGILVFGMMGGSTFYRTMFFTPHFCAGVATYILWKKLYNPITGPINNVLAGPVHGLATAAQALPEAVFTFGAYAMLTLMAAAFFFALMRCVEMWRGGELGARAAVVPALVLFAPMLFLWRWGPSFGPQVFVSALAGAGVLSQMVIAARGRELKCPSGEGQGNALMLALVATIAQLIFLGLGRWIWDLPAIAADGMAPPEWLTGYNWAKPALMLMGLWGAIGSNNMLLYIAGLSNVPPELYEAADIDGASPFQRFWHVTWPMLAPTTFFIGIMATIGGLRGGFEMARTMTMGGPAGSTTFLSYFIFTEGFDTGRLGYSSAVAWTLFAMTFALTMFNWKFGNRYTND